MHMYVRFVRSSLSMAWSSHTSVRDRAFAPPECVYVCACVRVHLDGCVLFFLTHQLLGHALELIDGVEQLTLLFGIGHLLREHGAHLTDLVDAVANVPAKRRKKAK